MKNILKITLSIVISAFCVVSSKGAEWNLITPFAGVEQMVETKDRVYFLSAGSLFVYDKDNDETTALNSLNYLNDNNVSGVYAPTGANFAVVAYASGNMDVLRDNGKVVNLPDIKDSRQTYKTIHHIAFSPDGSTMLVGTQFGIVRYNLQKMEVKDSGIFSRPVSKVGFLGDNPVMYADGYLKILLDGASLSKMEEWRNMGPMTLNNLTSSEKGLYAIITEGGQTWPVAISFSEDNGMELKRLTTTPATAINTGTSAEPVYVATTANIYGFSPDGDISSTAELPAELANSPFSASEGLGSLWFGTDKGIVNADLSSATPYVAQSVSPGQMSVAAPKILRFAPSGNLYIGSRGNSNVFANSTNGNLTYISMMTPEGEFRNLTPKGLTGPTYGGVSSNPQGLLYDLMNLREDPDDAGTFYAGTLWAGLYGLSNEDGSEKLHYSDENSLISNNWGLRAMDVIFDKAGYMWTVVETSSSYPTVIRLTPEGRRKGANATKDDWEALAPSTGWGSGRDADFEFSPDQRYLYIKGSGGLLVIDTKGTVDISDDTVTPINTYRMADGSGYVSFSYLNQIKVDPSTGALWCATTDGVIRIDKPWEATSDGVVDVVRPKVPRNDGSGLADYLLSTLRVYGLDFDQAGHKWFTTYDSGVFMTNADGTEIIHNFTTTNSPLPSNCVYTVACAPDGTDKVYFGTTQGLMEYSSGYTAPSDDYNNVRIYPNPIRPDYYGDVTIDGLMAGSQVKILSASGALVAILEAEGGAVKWSAMNSGKRVPAGVYHVLADSENQKGKPVGKIVVIR